MIITCAYFESSFQPCRVVAVSIAENLIVNYGELNRKSDYDPTVKQEY